MEQILAIYVRGRGPPGGSLAHLDNAYNEFISLFHQLQWSEEGKHVNNVGYRDGDPQIESAVFIFTIHQVIPVL